MLPTGMVSTFGSAPGRGAVAVAAKANGAAVPSPRPGANVCLDECIVRSSLDDQVTRLFKPSDHTDDALLGFFDLAHPHRARDIHVFAQHVGGATGEVLEDLLAEGLVDTPQR